MLFLEKCEHIFCNVRLSKAKSPDCTSKSGKVKNHSSSLATVHNIPSGVIATRALCSCPQPPPICTKHQTQISNRNSNIGGFLFFESIDGHKKTTTFTLYCHLEKYWTLANNSYVGQSTINPIFSRMSQFCSKQC